MGGPHVLGFVTDLVHIADKVSDAGCASQPEPAEDAETDSGEGFCSVAASSRRSPLPYESSEHVY